MNAALLMMCITNNHRGGVGSIDQPDHYFDDDLPAGGMDWFLWAALAALVLVLVFAIFVTVKR